MQTQPQEKQHQTVLGDSLQASPGFKWPTGSASGGPHTSYLPPNSRQTRPQARGWLHSVICTSCWRSPGFWAGLRAAAGVSLTCLISSQEDSTLQFKAVTDCSAACAPIAGVTSGSGCPQAAHAQHPCWGSTRHRGSNTSSSAGTGTWASALCNPDLGFPVSACWSAWVCCQVLPAGWHVSQPSAPWAACILAAFRAAL